MNSIRLRLSRWLAVLAGPLMALLAAPALADPPARVGRLADVSGEVWIYDETAEEWVSASRNRPITTGDRLSTERGGRAVVRVGPNTWRLDGDTEVEVERLDDESTRLRLNSGSVAVRLRSIDEGDAFELATNEGRYRPSRAGHYRIDRNGNSTTASVWSGTLDFHSDDSALALQSGQRAEFWREDGRTHYSTLQPEADAFAIWAQAEDREDERVASTRYVSPAMTGYEDLDRHGTWTTTVEYGTVWYPRVVTHGWAPYRYGHWAWIAPWGWTWVDDAPWGFAPFHYGRWVHHRGRWCWTPGRYVSRPVYSPALVAWVGGPSLNVNINIGSRHRHPHRVGWFPLGPREAYVPTYRVSPIYMRHLNGDQFREGERIPLPRRDRDDDRPIRYVNRNAPGAMTVVPGDAIGHRRPVARIIDPKGEREIARAPVRLTAPIAPPRRDGRDADGDSPRRGPSIVPPAPNRLVGEPRMDRGTRERQGDDREVRTPGAVTLAPDRSPSVRLPSEDRPGSARDRQDDERRPGDRRFETDRDRDGGAPRNSIGVLRPSPRVDDDDRLRRMPQERTDRDRRDNGRDNDERRPSVVGRPERVQPLPSSRLDDDRSNGRPPHIRMPDRQPQIRQPQVREIGPQAPTPSRPFDAYRGGDRAPAMQQPRIESTPRVDMPRPSRPERMAPMPESRSSRALAEPGRSGGAPREHRGGPRERQQ